MSKFKWIAVICIIVLLILPLGVFVISPRLNPLLNLVSTLMGEGASDKMTLGSFSFVASDQDTLTLKIELGINNTDGPEMLFPAVNLTFNYGSDHLGDGWINPAVSIPSGEITLVPIYAKMHKGEAFNKFLFSLIGGGLSLSIGGGQAFVFDSLGGYTEVLTIPLPSIPLPSVDLGGGATGWPPTIHKVYRGDVTADTPVQIMANVTDRGGGVKTVILSWNNGTGWINTTMTGLPLKPIMGGSSTSLGGLIASNFPYYPPSPILTACPGVFGIVNGVIPAHAAGRIIQYRLYVIDDFGYVTLVPSTAPTRTFGTTDIINLVQNTFSYTVGASSLSNFTAVWLPSGGGGAAGGLADMLSSLAAQGIDIFGAIMAGSSLLSGSSDISVLLNSIIALVEALESRNGKPFEVVDQLLGISGGTESDLPGLIPHINSNTSVALDLLTEAGIGLTDLITMLDVNLTKVVNSLGNSVRAPIAGFATLSEAFATLLNQIFQTPSLNNSFFNTFLAGNDLYYYNQPVLIYKHNITDDTWTNLTAQSFSLNGPEEIEYYFGSMNKSSQMFVTLKYDNFTILDLDFSKFALPAIVGKYQWEYYNGSWVSLPIFNDTTQNFRTSGRIFFNPPFRMERSSPNGVETYWIRLKILSEITGTVAPTFSDAHYSVDYIPYYFTKVSVDLLGRPNTQMISGEMDSFANLMRGLTKTPSYGMTIWGLLSYRGISYTDFLTLIGGQFATLEGPITINQILTTTSPTLAIIIYGILLIAVIALVRSRRGSYAIAPLRVKKWYDTMIVTPSLKGREEIDKYKMK